MTIQEAIEKAVEGGWKRTINFSGEWEDSYIFIALLEREFWQSLGKSMRWEMMVYDVEGVKIRDEGWKVYWLLLISNLAEGKSIEDYFKNLL